MSTPLKWKGADPELSIKPGVFKAWSLTVLKQKILDKSVPRMPGEGLCLYCLGAAQGRQGASMKQLE